MITFGIYVLITKGFFATCYGRVVNQKTYPRQEVRYVVEGSCHGLDYTTEVKSVDLKIAREPM